MNPIYRIPSGETGIRSLKHRKSIKGLYSWLSKHCVTIFLAIFLLMIVSPADASTGSEKNKKSGCRIKQTRLSYPTIKVNKKSSMSDKKAKRYRERNFSFPV
jgi:competence CoiA-like predicted nuclease